MERAAEGGLDDAEVLKMTLAAIINPPSDSAADATTSLQAALAANPGTGGIFTDDGAVAAAAST